MKKIFTLASIIYLIPALSHAQFETGQKLIGGNVSFSTNSGNFPNGFDNRYSYYSSITNIAINPSVATFYKPTALRGAGIIYAYSRYTSKFDTAYNYIYNAKYITQSAGINLFWQRFIPLGNNFYFTIYTGGSILYNFGKQSEPTNNATIKNSGYSISAGVSPGISYKINNRFLFDASLANILSAGFQHSNTTNNYPLPQTIKTHYNSFNLSSSLSNTSLGNISLGFRWLLHKS